MSLPPTHRPALRQTLPSAPSRTAAFTLVELLVSCGITMMLVVLIVSIVNGVLDHSQRIRFSGEVEREATLALDAIAADLEALLVPQQGEGAALRLEVELVNNTPQPWVSLLSQAPDRDGNTYPSVPRGISLRAFHADPIPGSTGNPRSGLYRAVASSSDTFTRLLDSTNPQADYWDATGGTASHSWSDLLADRLHSVQFRFQRADNGTWIDPREEGSQLLIDRHGAHYQSSGGTATAIPGGIRAIEVSLVLLSEQGDRLLQSGALQSDQAALRFGHHTTRRTIVLPTGIMQEDQ